MKMLDKIYVFSYGGEKVEIRGGSIVFTREKAAKKFGVSVGDIKIEEIRNAF